MRSFTPERFRDHALFIAFAPAENPRVAVAVIVENAGHGGAVAAPIARQIMDYVIMGEHGCKDPTWTGSAPRLCAPASPCCRNEPHRPATDTMLERLHLDRTPVLCAVGVGGPQPADGLQRQRQNLGDTGGHALRLLLGFGLMLAVANLRPETLERWSPVIFTIAVVLLVAVLLFGHHRQGPTRRWLSIAEFVSSPPNS